MAKLYGSKHVSTLYDISLETVRVWAEEFGNYLSPMANPGKNRHRSFTAEDMSVFQLVYEMKNGGLTFSDIHAALQIGQRGNPPGLEPEEIQGLVVTEHEKRLSLRIEFLERTLAQVQAQRDEALALLQEAQEKDKEIIRLKVMAQNMEERIEELKEQLSGQNTDNQQRIQELSQEIARLQREVGESYAKGILDTLKKRGDIPDDLG